MNFHINKYWNYFSGALFLSNIKKNLPVGLTTPMNAPLTNFSDCGDVKNKYLMKQNNQHANRVIFDARMVSVLNLNWNVMVISIVTIKVMN